MNIDTLVTNILILWAILFYFSIRNEYVYNFITEIVTSIYRYNDYAENNEQDTISINKWQSLKMYLYVLLIPKPLKLRYWEKDDQIRTKLKSYLKPKYF